MAEKGIDMMFRIPESLDDALAGETPETIVAMDTVEIGDTQASARIDWDLPDAEGLDMEGMRRLRDEIETRVSDLIHPLTS
jgi:protein-tyrosine-phosphatase